MVNWENNNSGPAARKVRVRTSDPDSREKKGGFGFESGFDSITPLLPLSYNEYVGF